jgi:D-tyrosyl-tRNA(Tyr) deacylase
VVQRVRESSVTVDGEVVGAVGRGLCVLLGVTHDDDEAVARAMAVKLWTLRLFPGPDGRPDVGADERGAGLLVISQFTLYGDTRKGRRPSWTAAAPGAIAEPLVAQVVDELRQLGASVATGRFGAMLRVALVNEGPTTVLVEVPPAAGG